MKKILITGGFGYVGGRLSKKLSDNFEVIASSRNPKELDLSFYPGIIDICHNELLSSEHFPRGIDTVIHLAALNEIDSLKHPSEAIRVNIDETRIILENAIANHVNQFIYFSTAHTYGVLEGMISEETLPVPIHPYAITHRAAEDYLVAASLNKNIHSIVLRMSNSFGAPVSPTVNRWTLLTNDLCRQAVEQKEMKLKSPGTQYRDFVCLSDVENVISHIVNNSEQYNDVIYNLGSGKPMRVIDMANMISDVYEQLSGERIAVKAPTTFKATQESPFNFSIERILKTGVTIKNDHYSELTELLAFCKKYFQND